MAEPQFFRQSSVLWRYTGSHRQSLGVRTGREVTVCFENNKEVSIDARIASVILELESISLKEEQHWNLSQWKRCFRSSPIMSSHDWLWLRHIVHWSDWLKLFSDRLDVNRQMVYPITCQVFFASACLFPNSFQGQLFRWFRITNHLVRQVSPSSVTFLSVNTLCVSCPCVTEKVFCTHTHTHTQYEMGDEEDHIATCQFSRWQICVLVYECICVWERVTAYTSSVPVWDQCHYRLMNRK